MVQSIAFPLQFLRAHAIESGKLGQHSDRSITDPIGEIIAHIPKCLGYQSCGICEIKYLNRGLRIPTGQFTVFCERRHRAHGEGKAGGTGSFLAQHTERKSNSFVLYPQGIPADPDRCDKIIRIPDGFDRVFCHGKGELWIQPAGELSGKSAVYPKFFFVDVHKDKLCDSKLLRPLRNAFCKKRGSDPAPSDYRKLHAPSLLFCRKAPLSEPS